jgi:hypothetical protein
MFDLGIEAVDGWLVYLKGVTRPVEYDPYYQLWKIVTLTDNICYLLPQENTRRLAP